MKPLHHPAVLAFALCSTALALSQSSTPPNHPSLATCPPTQAYAQLTEPFRHPPVQRNFPDGPAPVELTLLTPLPLTQPLASLNQPFNPDPCDRPRFADGVHISTTGQIAGFADTLPAPLRAAGRLSPDDFARLESLLNDLPGDGHRVPPPDRRLFLIVQRHGAVTVRLYDTGNLPIPALRLIRLTAAPIPIVTPTFHPHRTLTSDEVATLGLAGQKPATRQFLTVSPDRSTGVLHDFTTKTLTVYSGSTWPDFGLPTGGKIVRVIPEVWQPPVYGGYWVDTAFTPDARYLLVTWGTRIGALLYDTRTWQPVADPNLFPQHLKEFIPSADWQLGLAVTESGQMLLWDLHDHRLLSTLPGLGEFQAPPTIHDRQGNLVYTTPSATVRFALFSQDRNRVAIVSGPTGKPRFTLWNVRTGELLQELLPTATGQPLWWNGGHWLVAPDADSGSSEGVWDVDTGRFLGSISLNGCVALRTHTGWGDELLQPCVDPRDRSLRVLDWTAEEVQKQWDAFIGQSATAPASSQ